MDFLQLAMCHANFLGADYADIRIQKSTTEEIYIQKLSIKATNLNEIYGYGIRVFKNGSWGFAHNNIFTKDAILDTVQKAFNTAKLSALVRQGNGLTLAHERAYIDTFKTPLSIDPFTISIKEKVDMMLEVNKILMSYEPIKNAAFMWEARKDEKQFASTLGTHLNIETIFVDPTFTATAVAKGDSQSRTFSNGGQARGWEYVLGLNLLDKAHQVAEEAIMKVNADVITEEKRRTLILDPNHLALTMHESVGHPTELDRVLGWEADFAGVSFATPEKLKKFQYGSEIVNFVGNNTLEGGLASAGYDDDGVPNQKWYIVKDGILNEYGTTRSTAPIIGETMSRGCNRATEYYDFPINRIPNLYLEAGKNNMSQTDLINDTEEGVMIQGRGSFSIDSHRVNFQFGGDLFWEIKNGKKTKMLKKVLYKSNNPEFWNACDATCGPKEWRTFGITNCGKGQPGQRGRMTHGASTSRFRNIRVGGSQ